MRKVLSLALLLLVAAALPMRARAADTDTVRDAYRHFIMPTARAIDGGYVGVWELAFLQGGFNVGAISLSGGITALPTVAFRSQFAFLRGQITLYDDESFALGAGVNYLRLTSDHTYLHLYTNMTIETPSHARVTGLLFYKATGDDYPIVNVYPYGEFSFSYGGALGAGIGFDMPLGLPHTRFVAEAWNHDLTSPNKLAVLGAIRLESKNFSSDFGLMYFTMPLLAPVANFVWRF